MILDQITCALIAFVNLLLKVLFGWWIDMLIWALEMLPPSPFEFTTVEWGVFGNLIGYFIPVQQMITHFTGILAALVVWYAIQHILRTLRLIR